MSTAISSLADIISLQIQYMIKKLFSLCLLVSLAIVSYGQETSYPFRVRTVTCCIILKSLVDT